MFGGANVAGVSSMPKKATSSLTTFPDLLTVGENSGPTPIGIVAPVDSLYPSNQLTVRVAGLPSDGTVYLSDGVTPISLGQGLSVAQLTGLKFKPLPGVFGTSSSFTYVVGDPSGLSTSGAATLRVGPDTMPPSTTPVSLTVAGNSGPTLIGIALPTDPNYASAQLTITVTGLPNDGTVLLGDDVTPVFS